jgi:tetratricopeptide (TPR) repeat protein
MSIMQSLRRTFLIIGFLLGLIFGPVILAGAADLSFTQLAVSAHDRAVYAELAARRLPWMPELYEMAGMAALQAGEYKYAISLLKTARLKSALTPDGQFALGEAYLSTNQPETALAEWQTLPNGHPATVRAAPYLADADHAQARFDDEERVLRQWLALDPQNADVHYRLGRLLFADAAPEAIALFEFAAAASPQFKPGADGLRVALKTALANPDPAARLASCGQTLAAMGEWHLALRAFDRATRMDAGNALAWAWLAETRQQLKEDQPLGALQRAIQLAPASAQIRAMLGLYWQRQGNWQEARAAFDEAARLEPQNAIWQISLGDVYVHLGNLMTALAYYQKATSLAPDNAQTWRALALFSLENGSDVDGIGRNAALRAYALDSENVQNLDILGRTLMATEQYDAAETFLVRAQAAAPQVAAPAYYLAFLYLETGKMDLAKKYFQLAQTLDPAGPIGGQATELLARYFP